MRAKNVITFPKKTMVITRELCECGSPLEMWTDCDNHSFGLCNICNFNIGKNPIELPIPEEEK